MYLLSQTTTVVHHHRGTKGNQTLNKTRTISQKFSQDFLLYPDDYELVINAWHANCNHDSLHVASHASFFISSGKKINSSLANGNKSPSYKICQMHTQSSQLACPTWHVTKTPYGQYTTQKINAQVFIIHLFFS